MSDRSLHLPSIHHSWPIARFLQYERISSGIKIARAAQLRLINKLIQECPKHACIATLVDRYRGHRVLHSRRHDAHVGTWMVIPFHPAWHRAGLGDQIRCICDDFEAVGLREFIPSVSWSLGGKHLWRQIAKQKQIREDSNRDGG